MSILLEDGCAWHETLQVGDVCARILPSQRSRRRRRRKREGFGSAIANDEAFMDEEGGCLFLLRCGISSRTLPDRTVSSSGAGTYWHPSPLSGDWRRRK